MQLVERELILTPLSGYREVLFYCPRVEKCSECCCFDFQLCSKPSGPWWSSALYSESSAAWSPSSHWSVWKWGTWRTTSKPRWPWQPGSSSSSQVQWKFAVSGSVIAAEAFCTNITSFSSPLGVCGIAGVSAFANLIVQSFRFTTYADSGYGVLGGSDIGGLSGGLTPR